jgi:hypothetical protein
MHGVGRLGKLSRMTTTTSASELRYFGSCLCGTVRVEILGGVSSIIHCHCSRCRKSSGTAYATNGFVAADGFTILQGADAVNAYQTAPGRKKHFCRLCGSPLYSSNAADASRYRLRLGMLDSSIAERPISHNFVSSAACWENLDANLPRYDSHEPGR